MPKTQKLTALQNHFASLHYQPLSNMLWFYENGSILSATFFWHLQRLQTHLTKNKLCHMILEGLSSVCAKLEPASSKGKEILKINVLHKFTSYALCAMGSWI